VRYVIVLGDVTSIWKWWNYQIVEETQGIAKVWKVNTDEVLYTDKLNTRLNPAGGSIFEVFSPMVARTNEGNP
jgi:hypothetical protein